jgi:hypothetical protein
MPPPRTVRQPSLHCGISLSPRAAQGQRRPSDTPPEVAARPLRAESGQRGGHRAKSALCQSRHNAMQQIGTSLSRRLRVLY